MFPVAFINVHGVEISQGASKENRAEADVVIRVVRDLMRGGERLEDIGITTVALPLPPLCLRVPSPCQTSPAADAVATSVVAVFVCRCRFLSPTLRRCGCCGGSGAAI